MLAIQITEQSFPSVAVEEQISFALNVMDELDIQHIPVKQGDAFVGIISKNDLIENDDFINIGELEHLFIPSSIQSEEHILSALKFAADFKVSIVPVLDDQKVFQGVITYKNLIAALSVFNATADGGALLVLEVDRRMFSLGELNRLIETNNALITQLNTTTDPITGVFTITLRLNKIEISGILSSLQQYDYTVKYYFGEEINTYELQDNLNLLMNYLNI